MRYRINISIIILLLCTYSCNPSKLKEIPIDQFIGKWEIENNSIYNGIQIEFKKDKKSQIYGSIIKLTDNKWCQIFADSSFVLYTDIKRNSNFQFSLTENRIGKEFMSLYDLPTKSEYIIEFIDTNTIAFVKGNKKAIYSDYKLKRIK